MNITKTTLALMTLLFVFGAINLAFAKGEPTGEEIARAARAAKLNRAASTTAEQGAMKVTVTPMDLSSIKGARDLEKGAVVAVVDVKGVHGLPAGKYNLFIVKLSDRWQAFLESGGKIVQACKRVEVNESMSDARLPSIRPAIEMVQNCYCMIICSGNGGSPGLHYCMLVCPHCE